MSIITIAFVIGFAWLAWLTFSHMTLKQAIAKTKTAIDDAVEKVRALK